jgi:hypothetical protein
MESPSETSVVQHKVAYHIINLYSISLPDPRRHNPGSTTILRMVNARRAAQPVLPSQEPLVWSVGSGETALNGVIGSMESIA